MKMTRQEAETSGYNWRYVAYANSIGIHPDEVIARDGGNHKYINWINDKLHDFRLTHDLNTLAPLSGQQQNLFDELLEKEGRL